MGTALNKILKDLVVKSKSMAGYRAPYVPGWDCHGLPIEYKVVKETRGLSPLEVRKRSEEFARKYVDIQRGQFKRLGVLGDWERPYLTLDPVYEAEVLRAFAQCCICHRGVNVLSLCLHLRSRSISSPGKLRLAASLGQRQGGRGPCPIRQLQLLMTPRLCGSGNPRRPSS
jgi:isoleucyl-tRNA synthetase